MKVSIDCPECGTECVGRVFKDHYGVEGSPVWDDFEQLAGCDCEKGDEFLEKAAEMAALEEECRRYGI